MVEVERDGVVIDVCRRCHGSWFDVHELETIAGPAARLLAQHRISQCGRPDPATGGTAIDRAEIERLFTRRFILPSDTPPRVCPSDGATLVQKDRHGITIDWCPICRGIWLDRGELEAIIHQTAYRLCLNAPPDQLATAPLPLVAETAPPKSLRPGVSGRALVYQKVREVRPAPNLTEADEGAEARASIRLAGKLVSAGMGIGGGIDSTSINAVLSLAGYLALRLLTRR